MEDVRRLPWGRTTGRVTLDELAREGAGRMIATALEADVADYVERFADERDDEGKLLVLRNGRGAGAEGDGRVGHRPDPLAARE